MIYTKYIKNRLSDLEIYEIIREAVKIEHTFIQKALPVKLIGMNVDLMMQHILRVADVILTMLGVPKLYNVQTPFDFMEGFALLGKTNFFEKRVGEYVRTQDESEIWNQMSSLGDDLNF